MTRGSINDQLAPRSFRPRLRTGLGAIASFADLIAQPAGSAAWNPIQQQLKKEGASDFEIQAAQTAFYNSWSGLVTPATAGGLGLDAQSALNSAAQLVAMGQTTLGAVTNIVGLVQNAHNIPPAQLISTVTGTLIGIGAATGILTAGVGAAITAGVGLALSIFQSAGLFGGQPSGDEVCHGYFCNGYVFTVNTVGPNGSLGCCCVFQYGNQPTRIAVNDPIWRNFPDVNNADDLNWFIAGKQINLWPSSPAGAMFGTPGTPPGSATVRPIDLVFPQFRQMECNVAQGDPNDPLTGFYKAFMAAWKMNAAYALNGLKPQDDVQVFLHTLNMWNRAHDEGSTETIMPSNDNLMGPTEFCRPGIDAIRTSYVSMLAGQALGNISSNFPYVKVTSDGGLQLNTGKSKFEKFTISPIGRVNPALGNLVAPATATSTASSVAKGTAVVAGTALAATAIYSVITRRPYGSVWKGIWSGTGGRVGRVLKGMKR